MTGFASGSSGIDGYDWSWEVKSVNAKGLDIRCRVPSFLDGLDIEIKKLVSKSLSRGTVFINLTIDRVNSDSDYTINHKLLDSLIQTASSYADKPGISPASIDGLFNIKGVIDFSTKPIEDEEKTNLSNALILNLDEVVTKLVNARADEGLRMYEVLSANMNEMTSYIKSAEKLADTRMRDVQKRFNDNVSKLLSDDNTLSGERLEQEIAILAVKADITEEIDRLNSHVIEAHSIMKGDEASGRRLDFLSQEFNREVNTLCAKSGDKELTRVGLAMKVVIDQFREQIQNIE